jgi:hypothetical protein
LTQDSENGSFERKEEYIQPEIIFSQLFFRILTILATSTSIIGFLFLLSILAVSIPHETLLYPYGFILGLLLLIGGLILLLSLIILNQESKKTIGFFSSNTNQNKPIE